VTIKEIEAKSILRKHKRVDSWFISCYGMNLYRGCMHNCIYCDGRAEKYQVDWEFGREVAVKVNAIELLRRELDPKRKRKPFKRGFVMVGGGVCDSYQPAEKHYQLTRQALQLVHDHNFSVHMLTKSTLIERDLDLIKAINEKNRALVSFSFSSVDDEMSKFVEPGVPPPTERLETLARFKQEGIACGMFLMPVVPFLTDTPQMLDQTLRTAKETGLDFVVFGGMTLKDGRQKEYFMQKLQEQYPQLIEKYHMIYPGDKWGGAIGEYYHSLNQTFHHFAKKYQIPKRIPARLFNDILSENDLVAVILEQLDYLLKLEERTSPYGYAAYSVSQLQVPISTIKKQLRTLKGVGKVTERLILEILNTGTSVYYEKLLSG
jgi:DNA repair photolyase